MKISYLRKYIQQLLLEDAAGFVNDLHKMQLSNEIAPMDRPSAEASWTKYYNKSASINDPESIFLSKKNIKKLFNKHSDKKFLAMLETVHWGAAHSLAKLIGRNRDELSCTMSTPFEDRYREYPGSKYGLLIKGYITYAVNDHDNLYSGFYTDYNPQWTPDKSDDPWASSMKAADEMAGWTEEKIQAYLQRKRSSGINKYPSVIPKSTAIRGSGGSPNFGKLDVVLDRHTWKPIWGKPNEALVDNWKVKGIIVDQIRATPEAQILARKFKVPVFSLYRKELGTFGAKKI